MLALIVLSLLAVSDTTSNAAPSADTAQQAVDPQEKIICKRFIETGSLVKGYRVCKTKRDWARARDAIRQAGPGVDSCGNRGNGGPC